LTLEKTKNELKLFLDKAEAKQLKIINMFQHYFKEYEIEDIKNLKDGIEKLFQK